MKKLLLIISAIACLGFHSAARAEVSDLKINELRRLPQAKWGRDPFIKYDDRFKKPSERAEAPANIKISGIISDGKKAVAIVNNEFLRKGDTVSGFRIADIAGDRVIVEKDGRRFLLGVDRFALSRLK